MAQQEFIPYEQALELKELGFDEPCFGAHAVWGFMSSNDVNSLSDNVTQEDLDNQAYLEEDGVCLAPLYQQAFRWFREKKLSDSYIYRYQDRTDGSINFGYSIIHDYGIEEIRFIKENYTTYEESELACLKNLIDIVK